MVHIWYDWQLFALTKIFHDIILYVTLLGYRLNVTKLDFSTILIDEFETELKEETVVFIGTQTNASEGIKIKDLWHRVLSLSAYTTPFINNLNSRLPTFTLNLIALVGEPGFLTSFWLANVTLLGGLLQLNYAYISFYVTALRSWGCLL
ncbi:putative Nop domain superfamily protein [Helianthus anomalus]